MIRWLSILLALMAQCSAMMSPLLLRHCTSADGRQCIEWQSEVCVCGDSKHASHESDYAACGHQEELETHRCCDSCAADEELPKSEDNNLVVVARHACDCDHSPFEVVQVQVGRSEILYSHLMVVLNDVGVFQPQISTLPPVRLAERELRSDPDSHLAILAVVALRV